MSEQMSQSPDHKLFDDATHREWTTQDSANKVQKVTQSIDSERQQYLLNCYTAAAAKANAPYPFHEVRLDRADILWLLTNLEVSFKLASCDGKSKCLDLRGANLSRANLSHLSFSNKKGETGKPFPCLFHTHLEGADLSQAHLEGADLQRVILDARTNLANIIFSDGGNACALLADVCWGGADLSVVDWTRVKKLGNELEAERLPTERSYITAIRAYWQLHLALYQYNMDKEATFYKKKARVLQRKFLWWRVRQKLAISNAITRATH